MTHQRLQDRKFAAGQRHRLVFTEHLAGAQVQFEFTKGDNRLFLRWRARQFIRLTTQHRPNTGQQFTRVKRLRNVVVSPDFQANDPVNLFTFRRHHNDRHRVALTAQTTANRETIFPRQHQIQHHQVEGFTG